MVTNDWVMRNQRFAGLVKRYHTWPVKNEQSTGEHSWQVARIYCEIFGSPPAVVWEYIHKHDKAEMGTGDNPFHIKRAHPDLKAALDKAEHAYMTMLGESLPLLTPIEHKRFKLCDVIEMLEYGQQEILMGNRLAAPIVSNTAMALRGMILDYPVHEDIVKIQAHIRGVLEWT